MGDSKADDSSGKRTVIIVGLSGPSSSGKTTLARLLRTVFNIEASKETGGLSVSLFIIHEDDFYKSDNDIPVVTVTSPTYGTRQLQDWDCLESLDLPLLSSTLQHVHASGHLPPDLHSKEDQNAVGECNVSDSTVSQTQEGLRKLLVQLALGSPWTSTSPSNSAPTTKQHTKHITICILDGFLLYPPPPPPPPTSLFTTISCPSSTSISTSTPPPEPNNPLTILLPSLSLLLFLRSTRSQTLTRRARRTGYVTLEGFWADPPGYVEDVVWPNYVKDHAWMFEQGDVDCGEVKAEVAEVYGNVQEFQRSGGRRLSETEMATETRTRKTKKGILVGPGKGECEMVDVFAWGVEMLSQRLQEVVCFE